ncbi:MAG: DUF1501 domain-containing protein [Lysobacterales bacterium]
MNNINKERRRLLTGLGAGASTLGAAGALGLGFTQRVVAGNAGSTPTKLLVYLFLRGGMDGLSYMVPTSGANLTHYGDSRDDIFIDPGTTLSLADMPGGAGFGLNPLCTDLHSIRNNTAFIHACGHPLDALTRSHFDAQEEIELGTPGSQSSANGGFLARYLNAIPHSSDAVFTGLASSSNTPASLAGYSDVATLDSAGGFSPNTGRYADTHLAGLAQMYGGGTGSLDLAAQSALDAVELINSFAIGDYIPAGGVTYPNTGIGRDLAFIAQLWKLDLGIAVASLDKGGWDTHNTQQPTNPNNSYGRNVRELSEAVTAFYSDIAADAAKNADDLCVVIQSEFGRQVTQNGNRGTDHGYGNPMTVIGGRVAGGVYGTFPGIAVQDRQGDAVIPTTDFRQVHGTAMNVVLGNDAGVVGDVFPGYNYSPINIV